MREVLAGVTRILRQQSTLVEWLTEHGITQLAPVTANMWQVATEAMVSLPPFPARISNSEWPGTHWDSVIQALVAIIHHSFF